MYSYIKTHHITVYRYPTNTETDAINYGRAFSCFFQRERVDAHTSVILISILRHLIHYKFAVTPDPKYRISKSRRYKFTAAASPVELFSEL